jgi:hypothetical protein
LKALAAFVMRGRMPATMVAVTTAVLALLITPLAIVSSATVGLVALRHGLREAALVTAFGLIALGALGALIFGQAGGLFAVGIGLWLPLLLLGWVLGSWRSLALAVELIVLAGFGLVFAQHLLFDDPSTFWGGLLHEFFGQMFEPGALEDGQTEAFIGAMAPWMVGGVAALWSLQLAVALFLARAWQAALYNPGGFRSEFHALRLGRWLAVLVPLLLVAGMFSERPGLAAQLSVVGMMAFFIQGVSLAHSLVGRLKAGVGWLVGFYLLLFIALPHSFTAVSAAGFADSWLNFRAKVRPRGDAGNE